jgi:hypothetical protein
MQIRLKKLQEIIDMSLFQYYHIKNRDYFAMLLPKTDKFAFSLISKIYNLFQKLYPLLLKHFPDEDSIFFDRIGIVSCAYGRHFIGIEKRGAIYIYFYLLLNRCKMVKFNKIFEAGSSYVFSYSRVEVDNSKIEIEFSPLFLGSNSLKIEIKAILPQKQPPACIIYFKESPTYDELPFERYLLMNISLYLLLNDMKKIYKRIKRLKE